MYRRLDVTIRFVAETAGDGKLSTPLGVIAEEMCMGDLFRSKQLTLTRPDGDYVLTVEAELLNYTLDFE